jgi:hypothetical protein
MFQISLIALLATPFNYVGLFLAVIIIIAVAFYVYAMVQRVVAVPDRQARARHAASLNGSGAAGEAGVAREAIDEASMRLDDNKIEERPVHTEDDHDDKR